MYHTQTQRNGLKAKITGTGSTFPPPINDNDTSYKQVKELEPKASDQTARKIPYNLPDY